MENQLKESYQHSVEKYAAEVAALKRKNNAFITSELLLFGAMATCLVCYFALDGDTHLWLCAAFLSLVAYFLVRHFDDKNKERIEHKTALMQDHQKAEAAEQLGGFDQEYIHVFVFV